MPNKVHNALFDLIKSLSKSEKRYFKIISSRHTIGDENNYVRLFDYLDAIDHYDEEKLFAYFKGEAFLHRFSITKKRLYDNILKSLNAFHAEQSLDAQLYGLLQSAEVLYDRSLYDQCRRVLSSAEKLAAKNQNDLILQLVHSFQRKLIETMGYARADWKEVEELIANVDAAGQRISFINELWRVKSELFRLLITKGVARTPDEKRAYDEICSVLDHQMNLTTLNFESIYLINHIRSIHFFAIGDIERSYQYLNKNVLLFESNPEVIDHEPAKFISVLTNAIYIADRIGRYNESIILLNQLKTVLQNKDLTEDLKIKTFSTYSSIALSRAIRMGDFIHGRTEAERVIEKLTEYGDRINSTRKAHLLYELSVVYFGCGEHHRSLKLIQEILNTPQMDANENLLGYVHLLELVNYIVLDKEDLLKYKLKSVERFTRSRQRMHLYESTFFKFLNDWLREKNEFTRKELLSLYIVQFKDIEQNNPVEIIQSDHFDLMAWMESRLTGRSFGSIIRDRYNKQIRSAS